MSRIEKPYIISFVSGKGGVGKTMLAVAFARELSLSSPTLLIDLDFFNRGLSALLGSKNPIASVPKPRFLQTEKKSEDDTWDLEQITDNLYHITYPDLQPDEMRQFETLPVEDLADDLKEFVQQTAEKCGCSIVVLDCHGGPDNSSFAASIISDDTLLISEPDRVTFRGTLNFLRQLDTVGDKRDLQIHLVFNKVVPHFSGFFLKTFYNRTIRAEFGGRPLLGIFPLEVYLTKEFEKHPFLTEVYPNSLLAKKTRLMIHTLLTSREEITLAPAIRKISRSAKWFRMVTLGKTPWFLDLVSIVSILMVDIFLSYVCQVLNLSERDDLLGDFSRLVDYSESYVVLNFLALWMITALFFGWFRRMDRRFVYFVRARRYSLIGLLLLTLCSICFPVAWMYGRVLDEFLMLVSDPHSDVYKETLLLTALLTLVWIILLVTQVWKIYRLSLESQPLERALRALFFIYLLVAPYLGALIPEL